MQIVVVDEGRQDHEGRVLGQEGAREMAPSEVVVHAVEAPFGAGTHVVEQHHVQLGRFVVVGQDAPVHVFPVEDIRLAALAQSALDHEPVSFFFKERREGDGCQLAFLAVDFRIRPIGIRYASDPLAQAFARHGPDVELRAVLADDLDHLLRVRPAVHPCLQEADAPPLRNLESAPEGPGLLELDIRVPVPSFDIEREPVNLRDARKVSEGPLVRILGIGLLRRDELVVVVEDVRLSGKHRPRLQQPVQQHLAQAPVDVELVLRAGF